MSRPSVTFCKYSNQCIDQFVKNEITQRTFNPISHKNAKISSKYGARTHYPTRNGKRSRGCELWKEGMSEEKTCPSAHEPAHAKKKNSWRTKTYPRWRTLCKAATAPLTFDTALRVVELEQLSRSGGLEILNQSISIRLPIRQKKKKNPRTCRYGPKSVLKLKYLNGPLTWSRYHMEINFMSVMPMTKEILAY